MAYEGLFLLRRYSHFFKIIHPTPRAIWLINDFLKDYVLKTFVKEPGRGFVMRPTKVFASRNRNNSELRLHINQYPAFIEFLEKNYIQSSLYRVEVEPMYEPVKIKVKLRHGRKLHDNQEPIFDFVTASPNEDSNEVLRLKPTTRSRLVGIQTGKGKSIISLAAAAALGHRVLILIKPTYIEKWCGDVLENLDVRPTDIMTVKGGDQLKGLIQLAQNNELKSSFIVVSNRTHQNYISTCENEPYGLDALSYECVPEDLCKTLGVGVIICDEVHQEFFAHFKAMLHTHVPLVISLSATLENNNEFLEKMYNVVYPLVSRYSGLEYDKYIKCYAVSYAFNAPDRIRTVEWGSNSYSHMALEKSVLRHRTTLENYLKMIKYFVDVGFVKDFKIGDKLAVFASSIAMCTEITKYLKRMYPSYDVRRYVEDDPYENIIKPTIRVTTILSGGTAIDIPGLRTSIMTINVDSIQSNLQTIGRLRKLPDRDVKFYWLYCEQFDKHQDYDTRRKAKIKDKVLSIKDFHYDKTV